MAGPTSTQPTEVELQILKVLWEQGPSTVREIHNRLSEDKDTQYATTVKMLLVMLEKGLVTRDDSVRPQVYRALATQKRTQRRMLEEMIQKVYDGSAKSLVLQVLSSSKTSPEDLEEIRQLLEELKRK